MQQHTLSCSSPRSETLEASSIPRVMASGSGDDGSGNRLAFAANPPAPSFLNPFNPSRSEMNSYGRWDWTLLTVGATGSEARRSLLTLLSVADHSYHLLRHSLQIIPRRSQIRLRLSDQYRRNSITSQVVI